jgi:hypothetical protein
MPAPRRGGARLKQDRLVDSLVPEPQSHQPSVMLTGFVGKASGDKMWRLYMSAQMDEYVEFPEAALLHSEAVPERDDPLGGTTVWLRPDTPLQHTRVTSRQVQAGFLQGEITAGYLGGAAGARLTVPRPETGYACTRNYVCSVNPHIPACQIRTENCGSAFCPPGTGALCPTGEFIEGC